MLAKYSSLLGIPQHEYGNLKSTQELYEKKFEVWDKMNKWEERTFEWSNTVRVLHAYTTCARAHTHTLKQASTQHTHLHKLSSFSLAHTCTRDRVWRQTVHACTCMHVKPHPLSCTHTYFQLDVHRNGFNSNPKIWIWRFKQA